MHLRRFCRIALTERLPDESTIRKLSRRLGPEVVAEITRAVIVKASAERRFGARGGAVDSTVVEADVRWPSDAGLAVGRRAARSPARAACWPRLGERRRGFGIARGRWAGGCAR